MPLHCRGPWERQRGGTQEGAGREVGRGGCCDLVCEHMGKAALLAQGHSCALGWHSRAQWERQRWQFTTS